MADSSKGGFSSDTEKISELIRDAVSAPVVETGEVSDCDLSNTEIEQTLVELPAIDSERGNHYAETKVDAKAITEPVHSIYDSERLPRTSITPVEQPAADEKGQEAHDATGEEASGRREQQAADIGFASNEMVDTSVIPESQAITKVVVPREVYESKESYVNVGARLKKDEILGDGIDTTQRMFDPGETLKLSRVDADIDNLGWESEEEPGPASSSDDDEDRVLDGRPETDADKAAELSTTGESDEEATRVDVTALRDVLDSEEQDKKSEDTSESTLNPRVPEHKIVGYDIVDVLDKGSEGTLYRAYSSAIRKIVALRVMGSGVISGGEERVERELQLLRRLSHKNVCSVFDTGKTDKEQYYIVMEYVEGTTLETLFSVSPPSPGKLAEILSGIVDGLAHAHGHGCLHGNVQPSNIIINSSGIPVLVDFAVGRANQSDSSRLKGGGHAFGTPAYMAPEQVLGLNDQVGAQTDMFGLGVTFFEGISGRPPFLGSGELDTLRQIVHDVVPPLQDRDGNDVHEALSSLISICLSKRASERFKSMEKLSEALHEALNSSAGNAVIERKNAVSPRVEDSRESTSAVEVEDLEGSSKRGSSKVVSLSLRFLGAVVAAGIFETIRGGSFWTWLSLSALLGVFASIGEVNWKGIQIPGASQSWDIDDED